MKKGRAGFLIKVLLKAQNLKPVSNYLFDSTSTIGVRYHEISRIELPRQQVTKQTAFGEINFKETITPTKKVKLKPEFSEVKKIAKETNQSPYQVISRLNI